jgi:hypothetical protein
MATKKAALSAARVAKLVPESDFASLRTRMHTVAKAARDLDELSKEKTSSQTGPS